MSVSFLFLHLHCPAKPQQEAFIYKQDGIYYISGFSKDNKHFRLLYANPDTLTEFINLFFPDAQPEEEDFFVSLYCEDQYYYDRFRISCGRKEKETMQQFLETKEPVYTQPLSTYNNAVKNFKPFNTFLKVI